MGKGEEVLERLCISYIRALEPLDGGCVGCAKDISANTHLPQKYILTSRTTHHV